MARQDRVCQLSKVPCSSEIDCRSKIGIVFSELCISHLCIGYKLLSRAHGRFQPFILFQFYDVYLDRYLISVPPLNSVHSDAPPQTPVPRDQFPFPRHLLACTAWSLTPLFQSFPRWCIRAQCSTDLQDTSIPGHRTAAPKCLS